MHESERRKIWAGMQMYIHPLNDQHPGVYIVCDDQLAPAIVNVQDALAIGSEQTKQLSASLSSDFHAIMKKKVKSMQTIRKVVFVRGRPSTTSKPCSVGCWSLVISNNMDVADVLRFE